MLLYGPDRGLVRERSDRLAATVLGGEGDPFRLIEIGVGELRARPEALADAARSFPLLPGRQVLRVRDAGDAQGESLKRLAAAGCWEALVIVEAGDLGKRSSLRLLFEAEAGFAAVACHGDDAASLRQVIDETLAAAGVTASAEAVRLLVDTLGADRALTRQELAKIATYAGKGGRIDVDDVLAIIGGVGATSLADLAAAAGGGDADRLNRALTALDRGIEPIAALRATQQHLQRLHRVRAEIGRGRSVREAVLALRPPVFFRAVDDVARQAGRWSSAGLEAGLLALLAAEAACKRTGAPQAAIAATALLEIARRARVAAAGRRD